MRDTYIKSFFRLKSDVETPWISLDSKLRKRIRLLKHSFPKSEKYDYLMGRFYERKGELERAERYAFIGLRRRRLSYILCELMGDIALKKEDYKLAAECYGRLMAKNAKRNRHWMLLDSNELNADSYTKKRIERLLSLVEGKSQKLFDECTEIINRLLVTERAKYGEREKLIYKDGGFSIIKLKDDDIHGVVSGGNVFYADNSHRGIPSTFWKGELYKEYEANFDDEYILPVMATKNDEEFYVTYNEQSVNYSGKAVYRFHFNNWQYLRLQGKINIKSDREFIVGNPILLKEPFKRRKLVLNLLVDALSMDAIKDNLLKYMPNTYKFFSKGAIFSHTYGISDWTHPCTSSMFYGLELSKHQLYHSRINLKQLQGYKNVAENLHEQGYFCCNYFFDINRFLANDAYRGYEMHRKMGLNSEPNIADAIHLLQTISTNVFLNMHFSDVHQANFNGDRNWTLDIDAMGIPFEHVMKNDMFVNGNKELTAVERKEGRLAVYLHEIREMDRKLGVLYDFLLNNYEEKDYLVVFHSDHGGGKTSINTRHHSHTCLMVRGDGVPHIGIVDNEVVSAMDWFSIFEHFCGFKPKLPRDSRLPKAFGGQGREYAVTQRLYPNQTYALSLNDLEYEFYLQTKKETSYDGKIDLNDIECHLYHHTDGRREEIFDKALLDKYYILAYEVAKYFDEPDENAHDNPFDSLIVGKRPSTKPLISLVLDVRDSRDVISLLRSLLNQCFEEFELVLLVEADREDDAVSQYRDTLEGKIAYRLLQVQGFLYLSEILTNLRGEYVLFLNGEELLGSRALEALYYTAQEHKAEVVENICALEGKNREGISFPEEIYQRMMHPLDGTAPAWQPAKIDGRVSIRSKLWLKDNNRIHGGRFFIKKEFLAKLGRIEVPSYGFEELLALYLLLGASEYVRISVPVHAYVSDNTQREMDLCMETLLICLKAADDWLKKIPYLAERTQMQEAILAKFFSFFEAHYLTETKPDVVEEAVSKVLHKHPAVSSWLVKYLFGRAVGK